MGVKMPQVNDDYQLCQWLAINVMGWTIDGNWYKEGDRCWPLPVRQWEPTENHAQALTVLEKCLPGFGASIVFDVAERCFVIKAVHEDCDVVVKAERITLAICKYCHQLLSQ